MNRKTALFIAALTLAAFFGGCSGDDSSSNDTSTSATSGTSAVTTTEAATTTEASTTAASETSLTAEELAKKAIGAGEWPAMADITDTDVILEDYEIDAKDPKIEDICIKKCPMSAVMAEIIVIKAVSGETEYAKTLLETRKDRLINKFAFYPSDKEIAEAAIVGTSGSYAYLLAAESAEAGRDALVSAIG